MRDELMKIAERVLSLGVLPGLSPERERLGAELLALAARSHCAQGVPEGWHLVPIDGICPECRYAYQSHACVMTHDAARSAQVFGIPIVEARCVPASEVHFYSGEKLVGKIVGLDDGAQGVES